MLKKITCIFMVLIFAGCAAPGKKPALVLSDNEQVAGSRYKVAVLPFAFKYVKQDSLVGDVVVPLNAADIVPKYIEKMLLQTKKYTVVDRENLAKVLEEQKMGMTGLTGNPAQIGALLGADGIITGEIIELSTLKQVVDLKGTCIFTMKLIDIKSGQVKFTYDAEEVVRMGSYLDALNRAAEKFYDDLCKVKDSN